MRQFDDSIPVNLVSVSSQGETVTLISARYTELDGDHTVLEASVIQGNVMPPDVAEALKTILNDMIKALDRCQANNTGKANQ